MQQKSSKQIAPSLLAADFGNLRAEALRMEQAGADLLHFDVMDGHFVPNLAFGPQVLESLRPHSSLPFDVHLATENSDFWIPLFAKAGADSIAIHLESGFHPHRSLQVIKKENKDAGIVLNPGTCVSSLLPFFQEKGLLDYVLLMCVDPGFGGQKFLPTAPARLQALRELIQEYDPSVQIMVDGGVSSKTAQHVRGADIFVAGTAVFHAPDPKAEMDTIRQLAQEK